MGADIRFFVTGGTGFIGGHLVERLVAEGHEVVALVRSPDKAGRLRELGVTLIAGDLSLFKELDTLPEVDVVVHLAAVVTAPSEHLYESINYAAVGDLLACIERQTWAPKRLLFASSLAAAGPSSPGQPLGEDDPLRPIDAYGDAKARAEVLLAGASFPVTAFRPPVVFGPGDPAFLTLFKAAARGIGFKPAGAVQRLSFVYVADLVDALVRMAADDRPGFRVYFTPSEEVIDTDDLWAAMSRALDRRVLVVPVPRPLLWGAMKVLTAAATVLPFTNPLDDKQYQQIVAPAFVCSPGRLSEELGWRAEVGFFDAIALTARGYEEAGWL